MWHQVIILLCSVVKCQSDLRELHMAVTCLVSPFMTRGTLVAVSPSTEIYQTHDLHFAQKSSESLGTIFIIFGCFFFSFSKLVARFN